ncbi:sarcosine oxidase subunit gamma [Saccharomonospora halophila]|uniref:sarcosine oxidase subunit gamma n=1 Tax=Saccharomonospora halophila TaxID=129922 RepID=UPI00036920DA|nr:sarcosine oxidase subunit gamma family protein [Saccharomonospora halophila]
MTVDISAPRRTAESPLAARATQLATATAADRVRMREVGFTTQLDLRLDPKSPAAERVGTALGVLPPHQPGEVAVAGELAVLWLGPDEWLVLAPEGESERLQDVLRTAIGDEFGSVTDVSGKRTVLEISGPDTRDLLAKGCAVDLHPRAFGRDRCASTMLARAQVVLVCRDVDTPVFRVLVRSSFARYLADWLTDAAAEYGGAS